MGEREASESSAQSWFFYKHMSQIILTIGGQKEEKREGERE